MLTNDSFGDQQRQTPNRFRKVKWDSGESEVPKCSIMIAHSVITGFCLFAFLKCTSEGAQLLHPRQ